MERMRGPKDPAMTENIRETLAKRQVGQAVEIFDAQTIEPKDETEDKHLHVVDTKMESFEDPDDEALARVEIRRKADKAENDARNIDDEELPPEEVEERLMAQAEVEQDRQRDEEYDLERMRLDGMENPDDPENG